METSVEIPTLGQFEAKRFKSDGEIYGYANRIRFQESNPELIIYPNKDGSALTGDQKEKLRQTFRQFESSIDSALKDLPQQLRDICRRYSIDTSGLSDDDLRRGLNWHNVKLGRDGTIECYANNQTVSKNFDIVLRFSPDMRLVDVQFDG